jgi:predicted alpha/beta hydrolase family esterase
MVNVIIIHGAYGNPDENWFPWLKEELKKLGHSVFVPGFPTPENQNLQNWLNVFKNYEKYVDENSILVGHSLGPALILHILEKKKAKAAFFVAGFLGNLGNDDFDTINSTFFKNFDWESIRQNCKKFTVFHSDNDPYVPITKAKKLAASLGTEVIEVKNAGHFNKKAGYNKFEILLEKIKELL